MEPVQALLCGGVVIAMGGLKIFISHAKDDKLLADAWKQLIKAVTRRQVNPWYSSDEEAGEGMAQGDWRRNIDNRVAEADTILVILTPGSNERPWLVWESGFAEGQDKLIIPVFYFITERSIHEVFTRHHRYNGEDARSVKKLCGDLALRHFGADTPAKAMEPLAGYIDRYMEKVGKARVDSLSRVLFHGHFHVQRAAKKMEGWWYAKWTQLYDDGTEDVFEADKLRVWTTNDRIRMVGLSTKKGMDQLDAAVKQYPMEGVVSPDGSVALSYWSPGELRICGTTLLRPIGMTGRLFEGHWQGYTSRDIEEDSEFTQGRVVFARDQEKALAYWPELGKPKPAAE